MTPVAMAPGKTTLAGRRRPVILAASLLAAGAVVLRAAVAVVPKVGDIAPHTEEFLKNDADAKKEDPVAYAKRTLLECDAVAFDVDSTVVVTEGIDLLAKCFNVGKEVAALTTAAMNGGVKFQDAMRDRLNLMAANNMTRKSLEECIKTEGKPVYSKGVLEFVKRLHARGVHVYLVSGGFRNMILPIAKDMNIPEDRVYANTILFKNDGSYKGFDQSAPTSRDGGKPKALKTIAKKGGYKTMIMVGDGATDLQARPPAKVFIGYGGVTVREKVKAGADWFVMGFNEVLNVLPKSK